MTDPDSDCGCGCYSYNWTCGTKPEIALNPPARIANDRADPTRPIMVDACIAPVVQAIWAAGFSTLGSCCGHNRALPSLILDPADGPEDITRIRDVIATVDERKFSLHQWQLVDVSDGLIII